MNVPKLRFKEFNDESYRKYILKNIISYIADNRGKNPDYYLDSGIPVIDNFMIQNQGYPDLSRANRYIDDNIYENFIRKAIEYNDTLITLVGNGIGNICLTPKEKCVIIQNTLGLRTNKFNDKKYLYHLLTYKNSEIKKLDRGMAQPSIRQDELLKLEVTIPNINEQLKISNFLSLLDKKIELQSKKIEDLKLFKKGLNKNIFSNFNAKYKIDELIKEYNQKTSKNNQFEVLSSTANGIILQNEYFNKQAASLDNTGYKIVPFGFITYRSMSDTGEFHFNIQNITENGIVSPAYPVFEINEDIVDKTYFIYYINENKSFKNKILSLKEGGTRYALSMSKFKEINLDLPPLEYQKKYSKLLNTYNRKIKNEENKFNKLQELKKGLMQNMFV